MISIQISPPDLPFFLSPPSSNLPPHVYNCPSNDSLSDNSLRSRIFPIKSENFSLSLSLFLVVRQSGGRS